MPASKVCPSRDQPARPAPRAGPSSHRPRDAGTRGRRIGPGARRRRRRRSAALAARLAGRSGRNSAGGPSTVRPSARGASTDRIRNDSDRTRSLSGVSGWTSIVSSCRSGLPVAIDLEVERPVVLADELAAEQLPAVGAEEEPAAVVVVHAVDESFVRRQVQDQPIPAAVLGVERGRDRRRLVIGQGVPGPASMLPAVDDPVSPEALAGDHPLRDDFRGRRHGLRTMIALAAFRYFSSSKRRERQHVADVVEPVPGVIRREFGGGVVVHADQVADRVAVLDPVEPADRDATGVGIVRIDPQRPGLDPALQQPPLLGRRLRLAGRGHDPGPHVPQHGPPELAIVQPGPIRRRPIEGHAAFFQPIAVTAEAIVLEERPDLLVESLLDPVCGAGGTRAQRDERGEDGDAQPRVKTASADVASP